MNTCLCQPSDKWQPDEGISWREVIDEVILLTSCKVASLRENCRINWVIFLITLLVATLVEMDSLVEIDDIDPWPRRSHCKK